MSTDYNSRYSDFSPRDYLEEYFSEIDEEIEALLRFFAAAFSCQRKESVVLEFGGGPTIYSLITAARDAKEIHFCDYDPSNLDELELWLKGCDSGFNWEPFIRAALSIEGTCSEDSVKERVALLRRTIHIIGKCDALQSPALRDGIGYPTYDIVSCNFVTEAASANMEEWARSMANVASLVAPGGRLILTLLADSSCYHVKDHRCPLVSINQNQVVALLNELEFAQMWTQSINAAQDRGYKRILCVRAIKAYSGSELYPRRESVSDD